MGLWREVREICAGPAVDGGDSAPARSAREVAFVVEAASLGPGDLVLHLDAGGGCHARALVEWGLSVRSLEGDIPGPAGTEGAVDQSPIRSAHLYHATLLPFWEVEETHRARLRRLRALLADGGRICFGDIESWNRPDLERDRLRSLLGSDDRPEVRRLVSPRARFTHYTPVQVRLLLEACGFALEATYNRYAPSLLYDYDAPGMIVLARKS